MIALRSFAPHHAALDAAELLDVAMIGLNCPNLTRRARPLAHRHQLVARGPVFRVTVWGVDPKHQDKAIAFEMHARAAVADGAVGQRPVARSVRVDQAVGFQTGQPLPAEAPDQFEVRQRAVPAIETDVARGEPTFLGGFEHGLEMVILGQAIIGSIKQAVVAWDGVRIVTPHERDQVDARDNPVMFA